MPRILDADDLRSSVAIIAEHAQHKIGSIVVDDGDLASVVEYAVAHGHLSCINLVLGMIDTLAVEVDDA